MDYSNLESAGTGKTKKWLKEPSMQTYIKVCKNYNLVNNYGRKTA
jgi:hypothetical protein